MRGWFRWLAIATTLLVILSSGHRSLLSIDPAVAQRANPREVAAEVYRQLPELPLENQYVRKRNNKVAENSTLVSRFIEYHTLTKGRSPNFRLDWKITFADYLGFNDYLVEKTYPGQAYLKSNPMERDREVIQSFNRKQRADLTQALVNLHTGQVSARTAQPTAQPQSPPQPQAAPQPAQPQLQPLPSSQGSELLRVPSQSTTEPTGEARFLVP